MDQARAWHDDWPIVTAVSTSQANAVSTLRQRPLAVEVTLELEDYGVLTRIIEVPG